MKSLLPDEELYPTHTPAGVDPDLQADALRQLRRLHNAGLQAEFDRNDLMVANALSHSLSRPDMARAIGVSRSRVDQILAAHWQFLQDQRNEVAAELNRRRGPVARLP